MKVLLVDHNLPPYVIDGAKIYTYKLSRTLSIFGHEVHVLVEKPGIHKNLLGKKGLQSYPWWNIHVHRLVPSSITPIYPAHDLSWLAFTLNAAKYVQKLVKEVRPDIIHGDAPHGGGFTLFYKPEIPYVVTDHGNIPDEIIALKADLKFMLNLKEISISQKIFKSIIGAYLHAYFEKIACKDADKIIVLTEYERKRLHNVYDIPYSKMEVIPNFVDYEAIKNITSKFPDKEKMKKLVLRNYGDEPTILFVGYFKPGKGLHVLIEAIKILLKKGINIKLILVGSGFLESYIKRVLALNNLLKNVIHLKNAAFKDIIVAYYIADIITIPSIFKEGLPTTLLEAMAVGKPVVVSSICGIPEVIKDHVNGILVKPNDPVALSDKLTELIYNEDLRLKLGKNAEKTIQKYYDTNVVVRKIESIYRSLL
jgi:glycosyltransferase involved in cell wall biosynthesis